MRIVLPFNEETSSGDQADIDLRKSLPSEAVGLPISPLQFYQLRSSAVLIRKTVRAKMADEADLKQVRIHFQCGFDNSRFNAFAMICLCFGRN